METTVAERTGENRPAENKGMKPKLKLGDILEAHRGERHLVVLHSFPDPDAIAAGYAHRLISEQFDIEVDIAYMGEISHQQNIALVRLLGNGFLAYNPADPFDLTGYDAAVLVDHQGSTVEPLMQALEAAKVPCLLVVDHHQPQERSRPQYSDIQQTGSTSTLYAGYLENGALQLDNGRKDHVLAATALMHGIMSDTAQFVKATAADLQAAAFLTRYRDADLLVQILRQARSKHAMDIIYRALGNRITVENFSIAGIGYIRAEDRDAIPQAADFLMGEENIHTAIVYGIMGEGEQEEKLVGSIRTSKLTLDPDDFLKDVFGKGADGRYFGGGRPLAGGFTVPIGFLAGNPTEEYRKLKWEAYDIQVKNRIFNKIGYRGEVPRR